METPVIPPLQRKATMRRITSYVPGVIGRVAEMQAIYYERVWHMGVEFEALAAEGMATFMRSFDPARDGLWVIEDAGRIVGSIVIVGNDATFNLPRLRWFFIEPEYHGMGLGNQMLDAALDFCREVGHKKLILTTFAGLDLARHLYEKAGFRLTHEEHGSMWGTPRTEQVFELDL